MLSLQATKLRRPVRGMAPMISDRATAGKDSQSRIVCGLVGSHRLVSAGQSDGFRVNDPDDETGGPRVGNTRPRAAW
jgi:hypothetical protein